MVRDNRRKARHGTGGTGACRAMGSLTEPDFRLLIDGRTIVVEVKAIEESENNRREGLHNVLEEDIPRIRNQFKKANNQLHRYSNRGLPGIVCILDCTGTGITGLPTEMHVAMFGQDAVVMSVPRDPTYPPRIVGQKSAGEETLTREHNRSISAVLTFHVGNTDPVQYVSTLYHNHFARCPIDPNCAADLVNVQYRSGERERPIGAPWIRIPDTGK